MNRLKGGPPDIKPSGMDKAAEAAKTGWQKNRLRRGKIRPSVSIEDRVPAITTEVTLKGLPCGPGKTKIAIMRERVSTFR